MAVSNPARAANQIVVGIGKMAVSKERDSQIVTHALGSCLGITIFDPVAGVGGMLHAMLPEAREEADHGEERAAMFVNTGIPRLFKACYALGAEKPRLELRVAGGAALRAKADGDYFQIGKRNFQMLRKLLWKNNVLISAQEVGGNQSRTMTLDLQTGEVRLRSKGKEYPLKSEDAQR